MLEVALRMHNDTMIGLRTASEVAHEQLAMSHVELKKDRVEVEVFQLRVQAVNAELKSSQTWMHELEAALEDQAKSEK